MQAGSSALKRFRHECRRKLREDWLLWLGLMASALVAAVLISRFGSTGQMIGSWI